MQLHVVGADVRGSTSWRHCVLVADLGCLEEEIAHVQASRRVLRGIHEGVCIGGLIVHWRGATAVLWSVPPCSLSRSLLVCMYVCVRIVIDLFRDIQGICRHVQISIHYWSKHVQACGWQAEYTLVYLAQGLIQLST